jgi:hypothetical protein
MVAAGGMASGVGTLRLHQASPWEIQIKPSLGKLPLPHPLFAGEWTTGIGIDPERQTQDGERIYSAEYLRLAKGVACGFLASMPMKLAGNGNHVHERIDELFREHQTIVVGGQQRTCSVEPAPGGTGLQLPRGVSERFPPGLDGKCRVKWVLLTPAIYPKLTGNIKHPGGWLPNWICPATGKVLLKLRGGRRTRRWDAAKGRTIRVAESEAEIRADLVAACVPKPVPVVGWTERLHLLKEGAEAEHWRHAGAAAHGPRPTHLAVPAGAVYYFECDEPAAEALASALNWHGDTLGTEIKHRRSTLMGEKGFGLGVCGTWDLHHPAP